MPLAKLVRYIEHNHYNICNLSNIYYQMDIFLSLNCVNIGIWYSIATNHMDNDTYVYYTHYTHNCMPKQSFHLNIRNKIYSITCENNILFIYKM